MEIAHVSSRSRNVDDELSHLLKMDARRRQAWNLLFNDLTIIETVDLLLQVYYTKKKQEEKLEM